MTKLKSFTKICLSIIFLSSFVFASIEKTEKKSFEVRSGGKLTLETDKGAISVTTHTSETVDIEIYYSAKTDDEDTAEKLFDAFNIIYDQTGPDLSIKAEFEGRGGWLGGLLGGSKSNKLNIKFNILVPKSYDLDLHTSGGGITVGDLDGLVSAKTSGGGLTFGNITGDIDGKTSGGGITVGECNGNVTIKTSGGGIKITKCKGSVDASTSGGGITVNEVYGNINASTSGGSVFASINEQFTEDCSLETSGGGITVKVNKDINAYLDAKTSGGSVQSDIPVKFKGKAERSALKGELNSGGPLLYLRSSGGSIRVEEI